MGRLIQSLFYMLGGIAIWLFSNSVNIILSKNYKSHLGDYLYGGVTYANKSSLSAKQINFVTGIVVFFLIITILERFN